MNKWFGLITLGFLGNYSYNKYDNREIKHFNNIT